MAPDEIRFDSLKEDRGWYYVEYSPPITNYRFSQLQLSLVDPPDSESVAKALETEATAWLRRYPVPVMATAFSPDGGVWSLDGVRPINHLMAWLESGSSEAILRWELVPDQTLPDVALDRKRLEELFSDVPSKTGREIQAESANYAAGLRVGWWVVFAWVGVIPIVFAAVELWSDRVGLVVSIYALAMAVIQALRLLGYLPKSARQREKEAAELQMRHHHYHCIRNPEAFERLTAENFRRQEIERTRAESLALKEQASSRKLGG
jgi:hypothetical protein